MTPLAQQQYAPIYISAPWHPKFMSIPKDKRLAAFGLWVAAVCWCQAYRTDGRLCDEQLEAVFPCRDDQRDVLKQILTDAGLFDVIEDGIFIHDYLEHNRSTEEIEAARDKMREGGSKGGKASGVTRRKGAGSPPSKPTLQASNEASCSEVLEVRAVSEVRDVQCGSRDNGGTCLKTWEPCTHCSSPDPVSALAETFGDVQVLDQKESA